MKKSTLFIICILFIFQSLFLIEFISADVISLNFGGGKEIIINPSNYLEDFFSGEPIVLSVCGNGILEGSEECDDGNNIDGDGCSALCKIEKDKEEGGPSGGGEEEPRIPGQPYIRINPTVIEENMLTHTNREFKIEVINLDMQEPTNFLVYARDFDSELLVSFWDAEEERWTDYLNLTIPSGTIHELRVRFSTPDKEGAYNGTLIIDGKNASVSLNVKEKLLLFDSNIIVLNKDYTVPQGERLRTSVTLIPLGDKERMDVTLNYFIKDYQGKVYLTRSETVLIENQINFKRNFDIGVLPIGKYILSLELIYPNGVAPSSAHFEVVEGQESLLFGKTVFFIIYSILAIVALLILLVVWRAIKRKREKKRIKEKEKELKEKELAIKKLKI